MRRTWAAKISATRGPQIMCMRVGDVSHLRHLLNEPLLLDRFFSRFILLEKSVGLRNVMGKKIRKMKKYIKNDPF